MLAAKNLCKIYRFKEGKGLFSPKKNIEVSAVRDVSINIEPGQIVGVLGINGAGKTTTIKMLATLLEPTSGSLLVDDIDGIRYPLEVKKIINVITGGERNIYWRLTAKENLEYFAALYNIPQPILKDRVCQLLNLVGLTDVYDRPVERFSKGMKQRLQIARGLINNPKYLFLDEPTLGLDVAIAKEMREYVRSLAVEYNKGILLTSHYIDEVEKLCDYIYVIDKGEVIASGTNNEVIRIAKMNTEVSITVPHLPNHVEQMIRAFSTANNAVIKFEKCDDGVIINASASENLMNRLVEIFINKGLAIHDFKIIEPCLEDALLRLSTRRDMIG